MMKKFIFYSTYPIIWLISKLPFPLFYLFSDLIYLIVYYLVGYRKDVVRFNLKTAFPEKNAIELKKIEKRFYKHMCDMFLETIKTLSISDEQLKKRFVYENIEVLTEMEKKCDGVILMCGHYASYEWATAINFYDTINKTYAIYKRIKNRDFDRLVKEIRAKLGTTLINTKEVLPIMVKNRKQGKKSSYYMISDQSPKSTKNATWVKFMNQDTAAFTASEAMAKRLNFGIVFMKVKKVKRGYYSGTLVAAAENPKEFEDFQITQNFFTMLEEQIKEEPAYYLWTHKRWKHKKKSTQV